MLPQTQARATLFAGTDPAESGGTAGWSHKASAILEWAPVPRRWLVSRTPANPTAAVCKDGVCLAIFGSLTQPGRRLSRYMYLVAGGTASTKVLLIAVQQEAPPRGKCCVSATARQR